MAPQHDNTSSPRSSSGAEESLRGTPDSRITTISPEGTRTKPANFLHALPPPNVANITSVELAADKQSGPGIGQERDPFLTPRHGQRTRLSPTASAFNPFTNINTLSEARKMTPVATALSTDLGLSRCLQVSSETPLTGDEVNYWLNVSLLLTKPSTLLSSFAKTYSYMPLYQDFDVHGRRFHGHRSIDTENGKVYVQFCDIRDACFTLTSMLMSTNGWKVEYCGFIHSEMVNVFHYLSL